MNWTLEVVVLPVTDVDRAKAFYEGGLEFRVDHDLHLPGGQRLVQFTPSGSGCSVVIKTGRQQMAPGSLQGLQLVVNDLRTARAHLLERGVEVGDIQNVSRPGQPAGPDDDLNNVGFLFFRDPDGNGWAVQQISSRR